MMNKSEGLTSCAGKQHENEAERRIAACLNALEGIPTERIEGKDLGEILAGELRLNSAGPRADGGFGFELSGGVCQLMGEAYAEQFKQSGAVNYLELLFQHTDIGPLTITMQRVEGLTPAQKLAQAEAQRDELQQKLNALAAENYQAKTVLLHAAHHNPDRQVSADEIFKSFAGTEAIINQQRAEGIHFAANRMLAAWRNGFVDDTPARVHDISGAVLSALEFLPNASPEEFKRDYADEVRAAIAAQLHAGKDGE